MRRPVLAIGLDSADGVVLDEWTSQGHLKNLRELRSRSRWVDLESRGIVTTEPLWTTLLTGVSPERTGYWGPIELVEGSYDVRERGAYDYREYPPFYALGEDYRVAVLDVPQTALSDRVNGPQLLAWGAHSPQTPSCSRPRELIDDTRRRFGKHPAFLKDYGNWWDRKYVRGLVEAASIGIERRVAICRDWLRAQRWDLLLTVFGETHAAQHDFWCLSRPEHPLYPYREQIWEGPDPMLSVFQKIDWAVGEILHEVGEDTAVVVFSPLGGGCNATDVPSMLFLPELLYRASFLDHAMLGRVEAGAPVPGLETSPAWRDWADVIFWDYVRDSSMTSSVLRTLRPANASRGCGPAAGDGHRLANPYWQRLRGASLYWQPAFWYRPLWPRMKAFALPSYSEGCIRLNLRGREPAGVVAAEDYTPLCDELTAELHRVVDARTGRSVVKDVVRTRRSGFEKDRKLPDADLIVVWEKAATDVVEHPVLGRVGPVPFRRTGGHTNGGFMMIRQEGAGAAPATTAAITDVAPTILALMGVRRA